MVKRNGNSWREMVKQAYKINIENQSIKKRMTDLLVCHPFFY
jgi:hypothetical protein